MSDFADHFSGHAELYARGRPRYPEALYQHLAELAPRRRRCWDCATGNGQAALGLARYFDEVVATDASAEQLAQAPEHPKVTFRQALAEDSQLEAGSVDLVTVAAAAHWFDHDRFHAEVRRVASPGGIVALWTYGASIEVDVDDGGALKDTIDRLADEKLTEYWPPEFRHVRSGYRDLPFPFEALPMAALSAEVTCDLAGLLRFVHSWSAWPRYAEDAATATDQDIAQAWRRGGPEDEPRQIRLPLSFRVGRID